MVRVSLSKLEAARRDPAFIGQSLAQNDQSGGTRGFVSHFKSVIRGFHEHDRDFDEALETLNQDLWLSFIENQANTEKRKTFCESFETYHQLYKDMGLSVDKFQINLNWPLTQQAKLTGYSPFLCSNDEYNIAYFFVERAGQWQQELKYPLLQIYLAENFYKCEVDQVKIGVYGVRDKVFDLKTYEDFELDNALEEGKSVLKNVANAYNRYKVD